MIRDKVPEKPDMQDYLREHPWLIDPKWTMLAHEKSLDRLICDEFKLDSSGKKEGARRLDFFCLGDRYQTAHVVEAKRPNALVGRKEFDQLRDYVLFLRRRLQTEASNPDDKRTLVKGLLIADRIRAGDEEHANINQDSGVFDIRSWNNLLTTTEVMHQEFLDLVRLRAPLDDPRMTNLASSDQTESKPRKSNAKTRKKPARKKANRRGARSTS